ncbi:amidase, partial [Nocardiopsis halotolerans]|uniref:amidase n=1 Tax=Nocardiopsis halotolerans TaxID=124252 RepID=UPI00036C094F
MEPFDVVEATIPRMREALQQGRVTSEELVRAYLARIAAYDHTGITLNSVVVMNPHAVEEARASDARRARGRTLGPLDGIPYTAKDSYQARGLTVAAGSPAFEHLVAQHDSFTVGRLRENGAVLIGLTNMPPMANGGMQRGVYGRAESPYNGHYLTSAFASGSSNGSGTATAASFAAFGLAEETWSSGRAPASNNALCAYTPSWGVISIRGNWPLVPTMDVVVPHTRTMTDMLELLEVIVADDPEPRGDFWRVQPWIDVPAASRVRPASFTDLGAADADAGRRALNGLRIGAPRLYTGADPEAGTAENPGIGGPTGRRVDTRPSVLRLWEEARADLEASGVRVRDTDLPVVTNYEGDRPGAPTIRSRGLVSREYLDREILDLSAWAWHDFLRANGDPDLDGLERVDGARIFPHDPGTLPDRYDGFDDDIAAYPEFVRRTGVTSLTEIPHLEEGLRGLESTRRVDFEDWLDRLGLDAIAFPAVADVGPADADVDPDSADLAWRNGVWVANGNLVWRHLGIPTVTVPMGTMADTGMPVGLTFAGRA